METGFAAVTDHNQVEFQVFEQTQAQKSLMTVAQDPIGHAVLEGRLYHRKQLASDLKSPVSVSNHAALALATYRESGKEGLSRLEGDFALVIWDRRNNRLLGMRDPLGGYPLFWTKRGEVTGFATCLRPLLALLPNRTVDLDYIADFIMLPGCSFREVDSEHSVFAGIRRVLAGTLVELDVHNGRMRRHRYWNWIDHVEAPATDCVEEVAEEVSNRLRVAVAERVEGSTAAHLSGGMDSTSVALLARNHLKNGPRLHALSLEYSRLPGLAREKPYVENVFRKERDIVPHRILADDLLEFDSFLDPPLHDEPCPPLECFASQQALVDTASKVGADVILTGHGADHLLAMPPYHIGELLSQGRVCSAWREAQRFSVAENANAWRILYAYGMLGLLPTWVRYGLRTLLRRGYTTWRRQTEYTVPPWIRRDFARRFELQQRGMAHLHRMFSLYRAPSLSVAMAEMDSLVGDVNRWYLAAPRGIVLTHPFLDRRVVSLCLGIRSRLRAVPGRQKHILATAMRDVLPTEIVRRRGKGDFNEIHFLGLSRNLPHLEALVHQAPVADLGFLDRDVLLNCLRQAAFGIAEGIDGVFRMSVTLALLKWLSLQEQWQDLPMSPKRVIRCDQAIPQC